MTARGVVKIRLSGAAEDVAALTALLGRLQHNAVAAGRPSARRAVTSWTGPVPEILGKSAPYPNRREPGERVYLLVRIDDEAEQPPAPPRRQDLRAAALAQRMTRNRKQPRDGAS